MLHLHLTFVFFSEARHYGSDFNAFEPHQGGVVVISFFNISNLCIMADEEDFVIAFQSSQQLLLNTRHWKK